MNVSNPLDSGRRFWLLYASAWLPLAIVYAVLIAQRGVPTSKAISSGITSVVPAAILGAIVYRLAGRTGGPERGRIRVAMSHAGLALSYAALWSAAIVGMLWIDAPSSVRTDFVRNALGWQLVSGVMVYGVIADIAAASNAWRRVREQEQATARSEALRARAELHALRAQLDPHFLFNTLQSLMALVRSDAHAAAQAVERFGDLLRYTLDVNRDRRDEAPLADELAFVRSYLALEQLRLGPRLQIVESIDPDLHDALVPTFVLQPLVENSIRHAIAPQTRGGVLTISAQPAGNDRIQLEVRDDGPGASRDGAAASRGVGLRVLRQRLDVLYRGGADLEIDTAPGGGFATTITLPLRASRAIAPRHAPEAVVAT